MIAPGVARGRLIGGNLTVMASLVGTGWIPDMRGAILMLEDIGEAEYRIDRMLTQMGEAGILRQIAGFVFGQCRRCRQSGSNGQSGEPTDRFSLASILQQHIAPLNIPAFTGAHFGHGGGQYCMPIGATVEIDAQKGTLRLTQPIVAAKA